MNDKMTNIRRERFLCICGSSLLYQFDPNQGKWRVICDAQARGRPGTHEHHTEWVNSRDEAEQLWKVTKLMEGQ